MFRAECSLSPHVLRPGGLLVDTLMDPVLTSTMLAELRPAVGSDFISLASVTV